MCPQCEHWNDRIEIESLADYTQLAERLNDLVTSGQMRELSGTIPLEAVDSEAGWPEDVVDHLVACSSCGTRFRLGIDGAQGSGAFAMEADEGAA